MSQVFWECIIVHGEWWPFRSFLAHLSTPFRASSVCIREVRVGIIFRLSPSRIMIESLLNSARCRKTLFMVKYHPQCYSWKSGLRMIGVNATGITGSCIWLHCFMCVYLCLCVVVCVCVQYTLYSILHHIDKYRQTNRLFVYLFCRLMVSH